jgi:hypothetical protein
MKRNHCLDHLPARFIPLRAFSISRPARAPTLLMKQDRERIWLWPRKNIDHHRLVFLCTRTVANK